MMMTLKQIEKEIAVAEDALTAAHDRLMSYIEMTDFAIRFPSPDIGHCLAMLRKARKRLIEEMAVAQRHLECLQAHRAEILGG